MAAEVAAQAAIDKRNAQRLLLESAQQQADLQRKAANTTQAMAKAKQDALEQARCAQSETMARQVLERLATL